MDRYPPSSPQYTIRDNTGSQWDEIGVTQTCPPSDTLLTKTQSTHETRSSSLTMDSCDFVPQESMHPSQNWQMQNETPYFPPFPNPTLPLVQPIKNTSAAPFSISAYLYPVLVAIEESEQQSKRLNKQEIEDIATEAGIQPHDVYLLLKFRGPKPGHHSSPPGGLLSPDQTQEVPAGQSSAGATSTSPPAPTRLEPFKDPVENTNPSARYAKRQEPNQGDSGRRKRLRTLDLEQGSGSALEGDPTNKRELINSITKVTVKMSTDCHGPYECVSCLAEAKSVWREFEDHENRCHFPKQYFKCRLCDYQCAKADNGKNHLKKAGNHRQYNDGQELDAMYASCLCSGQNMFHDRCGFNDCQATFTTRKESIKHIRGHIKAGCRRSEWTHRCEMPHPFCEELPRGARQATNVQYPLNDNDDDKDGQGNGDTDGNGPDGNEEDGANKSDDAPVDDDDDRSGGCAGGAADGGALGDSPRDNGWQKPKDADLDQAWKQDAYGSTSPGDSCALSHFSSQVGVMHGITHVSSRMQNGHRPPQTDSTAKGPHYQVVQTTYQHRLPCEAKVFKVKVNKEYYTHVPGYNFSRNPESHVIELRAIRTLGNGSFCRVDAVEDPRFPGETLALKAFKQSSSSWLAKETFLRERDAMERVRPGHPHLIDFLGSGSTDGRLCILMSPVADMDLARFLREQSPGMISRGKITDMSVPATQGELFCPARSGNLLTRQMTSLFEQMLGLASALSHIHEIEHRGKMMCHGDIKPSNILVLKGQKGWNFRLADFGSADFVSPAASTEKSKPIPITPMYCAPECYKHGTMMKASGRSVDVWSLGCVFSEILTWTLGIPIEDFENFRSPDHNDRAFCRTQDRVMLWLIKLREIAKYKRSSLPYPSLLEMLSKMMSNNPDDRPTAKEVLSTFRTLGSNDTDQKLIKSHNRIIVRHVVPLLINNQSIDFVPDTGADHNVISSNLASQLNLIIEPEDEDLPLFTLADGTEVRPTAAVKLDWRFVEAPTKTFASVFYVMDDITIGVLGLATLEQLQLLTKNRHLIERRTADTGSLPRCLQLRRMILPSLDCKIGRTPVHALLDTGADIDMLSHALALQLRLTLKRSSPGMEQVELANGKRVRIIGRVKLKCNILVRNLEGLAMKPQRVTFHVMPELAQDVLFGRDYFERLKIRLKKSNAQLDLGSLGISGLLDGSDVGGSKARSSVPDSPTALDPNTQDPPTAPNIPPFIDLHSPPHEHEHTKSQILPIISHQPPRLPEVRNEGYYPPRLESGQYSTHISSTSADVTSEALDWKARAAWPKVLERFGKAVMQQALAREGVGGSNCHSFERSLYVQ